MWLKIISQLTGQPYNPLWSEKLPYILQGLGAVVLLWLSLLFANIYFLKKDLELKKIGWWLLLSFSLVASAKYAIYHFTKGYIPDRWIMYALPSPRVGQIGFLVLAIGLAGTYVYFREKIVASKQSTFILISILFLTSFSLAVAGIREGAKSIIDPLTRSYWEYTGTLPIVTEMGTKSFLQHYNTLLPTLPVHTQTHPPGYVLFLYAVQNWFKANYMGLAVAIAVAGSLSVIPLLLWWEKLYSPKVARELITFFIFTPSVVIFSSTSMEFVFLALMSLTVYAVHRGWKASSAWSVVAGGVMATAFLSNFLFLLTGPIWLAFLVYEIKQKTNHQEKIIVVARALISGLTLAGCLGALYLATGYSIVANFFAARALNQALVSSNFASVGTYLNYLTMNSVAFLLYLGLPALYIFGKKINQFSKQNFWNWLGIGTVFLFLLIGIFQGENERIWLFVVPFFMTYYTWFLAEANPKQINVVLLMQAWQIIMVQILFYTYW